MSGNERGGEMKVFFSKRLMMVVVVVSAEAVKAG